VLTADRLIAVYWKSTSCLVARYRLTLVDGQVVLEEFGKWVKNTTAATNAQRQQFYTLAYNMVQKVVGGGRPAQPLCQLGTRCWQQAHKKKRRKHSNNHCGRAR